MVRAARADLVRVIARLGGTVSYQLESKVLVLMMQKNTLSQDIEQI